MCSHRYIALFAWALGIWVSWNPLIDNNQKAGTGDKSIRALDLIARLLFAFFLCSAVLLFEKFSIQWIAGKFHERSYAGSWFSQVRLTLLDLTLAFDNLERIADQKFAVKSLVALYRNSVDIPGRTDTLRDGPASKGSAVNPKRFFKKLRQGVRMAATTTTTAFGNVASEIAGR